MGIKPSDIDCVYWSHSYNDLEVMVSLKTQYEVSKVYQDYESLRIVVHEALGGKSPSSEADDENAVGTFAELAAAFGSFGGQVGS